MARRVHQIEDIGLPILGLIIKAHGLGFDGNAAFFFNVHIVQNLLGHLAIR